MADNDQLLCLFSAEVKRQNGSVIIEIPDRERSVGDVIEGGTYRVAMYATGTASETPESRSRRTSAPAQEPPVEEGEVIDVEIEDMGEEGDGIARVGPGYVVFVPDTEIGERVSIELTSVRENVAFGDVVDRYDA